MTRECRLPPGILYISAAWRCFEHMYVEFYLTTKPSLPFFLLIRLHQSLISAFDFGNLKNEIPAGFLSLLIMQSLMLQQPKAEDSLNNELPVRFIITENHWFFCGWIEYCNSSFVSKSAMNCGVFYEKDYFASTLYLTNFQTPVTMKQTFYWSKYIFRTASIILKWERSLETATFLPNENLVV